MTNNDESAELGVKIQEYSRLCDKLERLKKKNIEISLKFSPLIKKYESNTLLIEGRDTLADVADFFDHQEIRNFITEVRDAISERKRLEDFLKAKGLDNLIQVPWRS